MWHKQVACWLGVVAVGSASGAGSPLAIEPGSSCTFANAEAYGAGDRPFSVALGDLDGDLDLDLVVANFDSDDVSVLLDTCLCPWDCDGSGDGLVTVQDLLALIAQFQNPNPPCDAGGSCDYDGNGCVDVQDLLKLIAQWSDVSVNPGTECPDQ